MWQFGNDIPGETSNFGRNAEYGNLLALDYTTDNGGAARFFEDFRNVLPSNPCPQG